MITLYMLGSMISLIGSMFLVPITLFWYLWDFAWVFLALLFT